MVLTWPLGNSQSERDRHRHDGETSTTICWCQPHLYLLDSSTAGRPGQTSYTLCQDRATKRPNFLERSLASHHVAEVDYTDQAGHRSTITVRPAFIRVNTAGHLVLWGIPTNADHSEELRLDRVHAVRDTREEFTPTW